MKTTIILISILAFPIVGFSQHTLSASGGEAVGSGGTSSYTYGQVFYQTESTSTSSLSQGVQQPFEISIISNPIFFIFSILGCPSSQGPANAQYFNKSVGV